ncbi:MAG: menaquinone biosynthesis protein [Desulfuromonadales bacterium]|nr:menaquinone biosynthesis protein [Desulfuromonadales bacterium]
MSLKIGRITYLNCFPYFHYLREMGFEGEILPGVPAELNQLLAGGQIDVCPSSSFEYALRSEDYCLLPGVSISSIGPVQSVLWFTPQEASALEGQEIFLTGESATSVNLLKVIMHEFCKVEGIQYQVPDVPVEELLAQGKSALLIGDRALCAARDLKRDDMQVVDLGAVWYQYTGLPFVFALWIARREAARRMNGEMQELAAQLQAARFMAFDRLEEMAKELSVGTCLGPQELQTYWQAMSYDLTDGHIEGLKLFFTLCHKHGLLDSVPEFHFFPEEEAN